MDPLGIIGSGQGYGVQQRQAAVSPAAGQSVQQPGSVKRAGDSSDQSAAQPQGVRLPEDTVSLSGERPQPDQAGRSTKAAEASQEKKDAAGDKTTVSGKSTDDPQVKQQISRLKAIEEKVKAHEAAHKSAGGSLAGSVSYSYSQGPDGRNYITGGEVQINISSGRTPQETVTNMQQVIRAALAPADPSGQDRAVAAQAASQMAAAQQEKLQAESPTAEPKPGQQVDPAEEAARQALEPQTQQPVADGGQAAAAEDGAAKSPNEEMRVVGDTTASRPADRPQAASQKSAAGEEVPQAGISDLSNQLQRAYADPSVQGRDERNGVANPVDAASIMGLFNPIQRSISSYA